MLEKISLLSFKSELKRVTTCALFLCCSGYCFCQLSSLVDIYWSTSLIVHLQFHDTCTLLEYFHSMLLYTFTPLHYSREKYWFTFIWQLFLLVNFHLKVSHVKHMISLYSKMHYPKVIRSFWMQDFLLVMEYFYAVVVLMLPPLATTTLYSLK